MQTWTAYERQQISHQFRSGCRFSICFAGKNADELNSSAMGKRSRGGAQAVVCAAVSLVSPRHLATCMCSVGACGEESSLSKIFFKTAPQKFGLGIRRKSVTLSKDPVAGNDLFGSCRGQRAVAGAELNP